MHDQAAPVTEAAASVATARTGARQRQTRTRHALLSAARQLMAQGARAAFTVDELIAAAGVAKGSFYNHFPDKETIAAEVHRAVREMEEIQIAAVNRDIADPVARITRGMAVYASMALTAPEDAQILTLSRVDKRFLESTANAGLREDLRAALNGGRIVAPSIEAAALLVVGQTAVLMTRLGDDPTPDETRLIGQQCIAMTLVGLGLSYRDAQLLATQAIDALVRG